MDVQERVRGCLLGGAIGDALGAPIEFHSLRQIRRDHGADGITGFVATWRGRTGLITDDTQMTLFTAEALAGARDSHAEVVREVREAYLRWLDTQNHPAPPPPDLPHRTGRLREEGWLYSRRAPGNACLSGLHQSFPGPSPMGRPGPVNPGSKGCGTVMRSAPFGLVAPSPREAFEWSAACAQITHGHVTGYLAAGAFAAIVAYLMTGEELEPAVRHAMGLLARHPGHEETTAALRAAVALADKGAPSPERVESLGGAWIAEEALAIGVYCALAEPSVESALLLSVNHSGDSDSTGSVCGNLLGARHGAAVLPAAWLRPLEGRETIERLAAELS
ncbi:ADP-ribosylglycohydrolase family protein [Nonomuraea terrae]|uniref:ADP-ribosylglycohydrolase family protein n=1 Tax=Nonomuraea terrae TaxID=2530383 RepID=A0A4R4XNN0_9ACTN|nr:ADP-ribosylglycohydrolase family protein [Nonomuraea terrae]TDD32449.1 ADP-ribosylglycohydrolase family protein [Nonomuraea terrae]